MRTIGPCAAMYNSFRNFCERLLRIPPDPEPPPGDEASTRLFRAAPHYYKYLLVLWALKTLLAAVIGSWVAIAPIVGAIALMKEGHKSGILLFLIPGVIALVFIVLRVFALAMVKLDFDKRWYLVTDRSLRVREGVVAVREMTVTFANIQNISISQGPIQRVLGLADLRVDTAGGGAVTHGKHATQSLHTAWFRGVNNAGEVRELIQQRLRQFKDAGLGDHEDQVTTASSVSVPLSPDFIAALKALREEATALRQTVAGGRTN
jgi:membrane protein YdbS with pleckstrin-like domain